MPDFISFISVDICLLDTVMPSKGVWKWWKCYFDEYRTQSTLFLQRRGV